MQWMVANAAAFRIKNRCAEQVVQVYSHGQYHYQPGLAPLVPEQEPGQQTRHQEVHAIVKKCLSQISYNIPKGRIFPLILRT